MVWCGECRPVCCLRLCGRPTGGPPRTCPAFDRAVRESLEELARLEQEGCTSMDRAADTFARLLQATAPEAGGRAGFCPSCCITWGGGFISPMPGTTWKRTGQVRAITRWPPACPQGDDEALGQTMQRSLELAGAAFQLGEFGCRTPILENILYLGLPLVQRAVFDGSWAQIKKQKIWRSSQ